MKLKSILISMTIISGLTANAATYYVSPEGSGFKDGSDAENAFGVEEFTAQAAANVNGDIYYFAGGIYTIPTTVVFNVGTGAYLYGNEDGGRTIFSGDLNGNNNPENGDAGRLIRFQANTVDGNSANAIVVKNIDFTCVFTNTDDSSNNSGAFAVDNSGDVLVENCNFYNNWADGQQGGPAAYLNRSTVRFIGCIFSNNKANYRGGAIRINSNANTKGLITFENCVIKNNINYHNLGGAIYAANFNSINIVNSTIYGNSAATGSGAAIYFNGLNSDYPRLLRVVNSTIAGNSVGDSVVTDGQIASTQSANIYVANSIIPSSDNCQSIYLTGDSPSEDFILASGGYNYIDGIASATDLEIEWQDTDYSGEDCTYVNIFGDNTLNNNVLLPQEFYLGATGEEVVSAVNDWNLPAGLELTTDQLGNARTGEVTMGAVALTAEDIENDDNGEGDGDTGAVNSITAETKVVTVYNLQGIAVKSNVNMETVKSIFPSGLYIINGKKVLIK
ncbi:MAG: right-handed parallel beta-helix repeat-containing protein [Muribaculaceae bacterium]|nr:right-handed parallel beta-helix repeat-containing protein [Muribaculaceae bacterium]